MNAMAASADYGVLQSVVSSAGAIMAAGGAVALTWRKRVNWEPSDQDISKGPEKVGGLVGALCIAVLYFLTKGSSGPPVSHFLIDLIIAAGSVCVVALLAYIFLTSMQTYTALRFTRGAVAPEKVIGGFALTPKAKEVLRTHDHLTVQELFEGSAYDVDKVWTRRSRSSAKLLFVTCYLGLTVSGTVALAGAAILIGGR